MGFFGIRPSLTPSRMTYLHFPYTPARCCHRSRGRAKPESYPHHTRQAPAGTAARNGRASAAYHRTPMQTAPSQDQDFPTAGGTRRPAADDPPARVWRRGRSCAAAHPPREEMHRAHARSRLQAAHLQVPRAVRRTARLPVCGCVQLSKLCLRVLVDGQTVAVRMLGPLAFPCSAADVPGEHIVL